MFQRGRGYRKFAFELGPHGELWFYAACHRYADGSIHFDIDWGLDLT